MEELSIVCEPTVAYRARGFEASECEVIQSALAILRRHLDRKALATKTIASPNELRDYLCLRLAPISIEAFGVVWLDPHHRILSVEEMFRGTLTQTSVYPREIVRRALTLNASSVVLYHNHPSGIPQPSEADKTITFALRSALALVDVRVLDHLIVGAAGTCSMAETGLL